MDRLRKKELLQQYKEMKPEMGVYMFKSKKTNTVYLGYDKNIKATINGDRFKLNLNSHRYKKLQKDWNENKEENFEIRIVEVLPYDKDESKVDYSEDLKILREMCKDRFIKKNVEEI
ncbi:GIY-YIG nuclease family protein [Paraclostridium sordellii]|uniref:GIY-YIG nuclease family protein n=1 Tax=Paraclostridium sordellii TaxID=1505 RepID=UPI0005E942E5|nr:GIY-YIG nuclease family protein [Paeniclostridium sordellii]CEO28106.1 nuclease [[Clostridium] sordellii] [Paeniclostridium sordellii]CEP48116.1 nuclease [[Clostridium] sordellii] [Paeniclostridium sordellii]